MEPHRIGDFAVLAYHNVQGAPRIHAQLRAANIDAAVVDHSFVLSALQLATALHRIHTGAVCAASIASKRRDPREPTARNVFVALSLTHNLDAVLQSLPAGPSTTAVVIILRNPSAADLAAVEAAVGDSAVAHRLWGFGGHNGPLAGAALVSHASPRACQTYYNISERDVREMRRSLSSLDVVTLKAQVSGGDEAADQLVAQLVDVKALEMCVVNKLATCDV